MRYSVQVFGPNGIYFCPMARGISHRETAAAVAAVYEYVLGVPAHVIKWRME